MRAGTIWIGAVVLLASAGAVRAETCRRAMGAEVRSSPDAGCPERDRVTPYEPERVRAGRAPGFIDLGNGSEVRIGGSARFDYDTRRR